MTARRARLRAKADSRLMKFVGFFLRGFTATFWTTLRFPFCRPVIYYPMNARSPQNDHLIIWHELKHVEQFAPWYGPYWMLLLYTVAPLPVLFSGRWFIERTAYLRDIDSGRLTVDQCVGILWQSYLWPWPKSLMRKWFEAKRAES